MSKALIVIDLQNDYATGGAMALHGIEAAVANAAKIIADFRSKNIPVIHIQHIFSDSDAPFFRPDSQGAEIQKAVQPLNGEDVVVKNNVNAFLNTDLQNVLDKYKPTELVILGAMSHMCVDAGVRAASDLGYNITVIHDACATLELEFNGIKVPAEQVHAAFMASLKFAYADLQSAVEYLTI